MKKVNNLKAFPFLKFHTVIGGIVGLVLGILYSFGGLIVDALVSLDWITTPETPGLSFGTVLAFGALIGMPIIFAPAGLVVGLVELVVFKLFGRWLAWLDIDFEEKN